MCHVMILTSASYCTENSTQLFQLAVQHGMKNTGNPFQSDAGELRYVGKLARREKMASLSN